MANALNASAINATGITLSQYHLQVNCTDAQPLDAY
jgi:hypothetical protein